MIDDKKVLQDLEDFVEVKKVNKLMNSKIIRNWVKFYEAWFLLKINLRDFAVLNSPRPGHRLYCIPKEITLDKVVEVFTEKYPGFIFKKSGHEIIKLREKEFSSYLVYRSEGRVKFLEVILFDLFEFYIKGKISLRNKRSSGDVRNHSSYYDISSAERMTEFPKAYISYYGKIPEYQITA